MSEQSNEKQIHFDPTDLAAMIDLMDAYGSSNTMFPGQNEIGEVVYIFIFQDKIVTSTFQPNNWTRKSIYCRDGNSEELYKK